MPRTSEPEVNIALGEVLRSLRPTSWSVRTEPIGAIHDSAKRPDVIIADPAGWPVAIEGEWEPAATVEADAASRLGLRLTDGGLDIETAIAVIYPLELDGLSGGDLRNALSTTNDLRFSLFSRVLNQETDRLPHTGWLRGDLRQLAQLVHRAAAPVARVDALAAELEIGVSDAAAAFTKLNPYGETYGQRIADVIGQSDDDNGQTRRMAMTIIINALIFHQALSDVGFSISTDGKDRTVAPVVELMPHGFLLPSQVVAEWRAILERNYFPIFWSASTLIARLSTTVAGRILDLLWRSAEQLITGGVTKSHDLTGVVFQRLIADRKFLATFYTQPAAAALLATLALPADEPPAGAAWADSDTLGAIQIGDFACGTGTLLSAACQRVALLHELSGGSPAELHPKLMEHGLVGLDVLNSAVHLTATMLASSRPEIPFDGECLLTMPYGVSGSVASVGSLGLLAEHAQSNLIERADAITAGGRGAKRVQDIVSRIGHGQFDLVIMNPPFSRATSHEALNIGTGNPALAAMNTTREDQIAMLKALNQAAGSAAIGNIRAGLGTHFTDLAIRKVRDGGTIALVLPMSFAAGGLWSKVRAAISEHFETITIISIAASGSSSRSFSADTDIAECLMVAAGKGRSASSMTAVVLERQPASIAHAEQVGEQIAAALHDVPPRLDDRPRGAARITIGDEPVGYMIQSDFRNGGAWRIVGIDDPSLAQCAYHLMDGKLYSLNAIAEQPIEMPIALMRDLVEIGFSDMEISGDKPDGDPQGPFEIVRPISASPTYPILWSHDAKRERTLSVVPDCEGQIKRVRPELQPSVDVDAATIWRSASLAHWNRDCQFNSQSIIVALTPQNAIGGRAWPTIRAKDERRERALALWYNSTLGLLLYWWSANKSQSGRGSIPIGSIPDTAALDVDALSNEQLGMAENVLSDVQYYPFLPLNQIDEDICRHELDRRLFVDVLGCPAEICDEGGPIDLIRKKLASEPQIHGGKKSRIEFVDPDDERPINPAPQPPPARTPIRYTERQVAR